MLTKLLSLLLVVAISLAGYFGYKYKQVEGRYDTINTSYAVLLSDKLECESIIKDNTTAVESLQKQLKGIPKVLIKYSTRIKTVYEKLDADEKNVLDADLPPSVISLLNASSEDPIR